VIIRVRIRRVMADARLGVDAAAIRSGVGRELAMTGETTAAAVKQRLERALRRTVDSRAVR